MFYGRESELAKLNRLYESGRFECVILHGRRRVGKTALLCEFLKRKKAIYFAAQETCSRENIKTLAHAIDSLGRDTMPASWDAKEYDDIFDRVYNLARAERITLIIDDYQFLVQGSKDISGLICAQIAEKLQYSRLMLIICGSSEPVMEKETLGFSSPFHGHRTAQIMLQPFTFFEARQYYSSFSLYDITLLYGMTGGVPKYLDLMSADLPIEDNIRRNFLSTSSFLFEEPANILRREVRDPTYYNAVLRAIAAGCDKNSEISAAVDLDTAACTAYLKNLISLHIVSKHTPIAEKSGKKTIYEVADSMFRFWYRYVPPNISLIRSSMTSRIWRSIAQDIPLFMGSVFHDICRQWLHMRNTANRLPIKVVEFGRWWGFDPIRKEPTSVPIIAYADDDNAIFGDCIWSDEPVNSQSLEMLILNSRLFSFRNKHIYLFSPSGFTNECTELAKKTGANLVVFE